MKTNDWKLTDQEKAECQYRNVNLHEAQEAKKQVYINAGGVILNPDALEDLYEALQLWKQWLSDPEMHYAEIEPIINTALAEAKVK